MEENFLQSIIDVFSCGERDANALSPLTLAYIGDGVYDLVIRTIEVELANRPANDLHKHTIRFVSAPAQSAMIQALLNQEGFLTQEEIDIYKRGRNAKSHTSAKNASISDYRRATGFEALIGYLYLRKDTHRLMELVKKGIELTNLKY